MKWMLLSFIIVQSCNNDKTAEGKIDSLSSDTAPNAQQQPAALAAGPFTILKIDSADLVTLFSNNNVKKLLIQFLDSNVANSKITGIAYGAKGNNDTLNGWRMMQPASVETWDTTGIKILGNNQLTERQIKRLLGGNVNTHARTLYFYPKKSSDNHIYFIVSRQLTSFTKAGDVSRITYPADGESTKPSPPAPPGEDL